MFFGVVVLLLAMGAAWGTYQVKKALAQLKRDVYYQEQKVKGMTHKVDAAIEALRIQLVNLSRGQQVSEQLIREGKLYQELSSNEAESLLASSNDAGGLFILDVRTAGEFTKGHLANAHHIAVEDLDGRFREEIPTQYEKIVVYCNGGDRSRLACEFLSRQGMSNIYWLNEGLQGWSGPLTGNNNSSLIQISPKENVRSYSS